GIALALTVIYLYQLAEGRRARDLIFSLSWLGGMIGMAWMSRLKAGGYDNVLIPAYAVLAVHFGLGLDRLLALAADAEKTRSEVPALHAPVYAACLIQFIALFYNPMKQVPSAADRAAGDRLVARLSSVDGKVLVPSHGYLGSVAGKNGSA